ncbi:MAG: sigma-70 family RNA polymerase sigma factor [Flavipsychrobacter sp.]|nr:sigma-70 family RNA polymerase sigma factor [Flavipsychrobacter sp.]
MKVPSPHSLSDEELLQLHRTSSDNYWLGQLLQRYTLLLLGVAMKYLKDKEQAQDAVQQIFLKALTQLPAGEIQNFKGWLYILMRNHCLQLLRHAGTVRADHLEYVPDSIDEPDDIPWKNYSVEELSAALADLQHEQKICIVLFYLQQKSYQQIMEHTSYTFAQVKSYIQNGKRNLKAILLKKHTTGRPNE